jgi:hypothetical protein
MDWMVSVYHNHRRIERRMRNLKSDLPIRPLYVHRDDEIVALCFVSLLSLTLYTLIERDVQADPELVAEGLRTTDALLAVLSGWGLSAFYTPSGYEHFWLDTLSALQQLIAKRLCLIDPGTRLPRTRQVDQSDHLAMPDPLLATFCPSLLPSSVHHRRLQPLSVVNFLPALAANLAFFAIVNVLSVMSD